MGSSVKGLQDLQLLAHGQGNILYLFLCFHLQVIPL